MLVDSIKITYGRQNQFIWIEGRDSRIIKHTLGLHDDCEYCCLLTQVADLVEIYNVVSRFKCYIYNIELSKLLQVWGKDYPVVVSFIPGR